MSLPDNSVSIAEAAPLLALVIGATGRFTPVADLLLQRGHRVRLATRSPAGAAAARLSALGAEIVQADFSDPGSLAAAAHGVDAVFASGTAHKAGPEGEARHGQNLAQALATAGAPYLVFISGAGADRPTGVPVLEAKRAVEAEIRKQRVPCTLIAPAYLMENLFNPWNLAALRTGVLPTPISPSSRLPQAATADLIALSAWAVEHQDMLAGERIEVASDEPTGEAMAAAVSAHVGRDLAAKQLPREGLPSGLAALFAWLERDPVTVDARALAERFPHIRWHPFSHWAGENQPEVTAALQAAS